MAQESVTIFNDTVLKLSINQGLEEQRVQETLGSFTMGELAFTRDTGRVFVGDNSDGIGDHADLPSTIGGILVGNKYLGIIDSKPLSIFTDNSTPLSYEENTHFSGSKELPQMDEKALLKEESKFRDKSASDAKTKWSNWPRAAEYNKTYNAYNGDYMFDPYQSAFILFDNRISGKENAASQPKVKTDKDGVPVSPETFIVDGQEIPSSDPRAIDIKRRTKTVNYIVNGEDKSAFPIYGDGYVIARILEPDNVTIKVKQRTFGLNGEATSSNNISHNILEIGSIKTENMDAVFNDDFIVGEEVALNKNIKDVLSITTTGNGLKVPQQLIFSTPVDPRGATGKMKWIFSTPDYSTFSSGKQYEAVFTSNGTERDRDFSNNNYQSFSIQLKEKVQKIQTYYINLGDGLVSSQSNNKKVILDQRATVDGNNVPYISLDTKYSNFSEINPDYVNPYNVNADANFSIVYSSNFGINDSGSIAYIDEYSPMYYSMAKSSIDKWEGKNTSINFIRKPVTIMASSNDSTLFSSNTQITGLKVGVNAYVDFFVDPYLYCGRKVISASSTAYLPKLADLNNYPTKSTSTYFDNFSNTNIDVWNSLFVVLGNNHYKSLKNTTSTEFFIDGLNGDHTKTDCASGYAIKKIPNIELNASYGKVSRASATEDQLKLVSVFAWEKRVTGNTTTWTVADKFDTRTDSDIDFYGEEITEVKLNGTNILTSNDANIVEKTRTEGTTKITTRYLTPESALLDGIKTKITYGTAKWTQEVDLTKQGHIEYSNEMVFYKDDGNWTDEFGNVVSTLDLIAASDSAKTTINAATTKTILDATNGHINVNYNANGLNVRQQKIVAAVSSSGGKSYFFPTNGVYYVLGARLPAVVSAAKIKESGYTEVSVDERIQEANKVVVPAHAQSILLEVEHKTTDSSPIAIFYANEFSELGLLLSGFNTQEDTATTSYNSSSLSNSGYTLSSGTTYKQSMGVNIPESDTTKDFHSLSKTIDQNTALRPSCFYAAPNEKPLFLSNCSETRVIEVPLHKSKYNSLKHFSLRFANIRPTTTSAQNSIAVRVIGYRV